MRPGPRVAPAGHPGHVMRLIRSAGLAANAWKNAGGETRQIAVSPTGADLDAFDWRLSMATVAKDGPFSAFPGVSRTLCLLTGDGLELRFDDGRTSTLRPGDRTDFAADSPVHGRLTGGPVGDLNIMVRRAAVRAAIRQVQIKRHAELHLPWAEAALFVVSGQVAAQGPGEANTAGRHDTWLFGAGHCGAVCLEGAATLIVMGFDPY